MTHVTINLNYIPNMNSYLLRCAHYNEIAPFLSVFVCLFFFIYFGLCCLSCGMDPSRHSVSHRQPAESRHINIMLTGLTSRIVCVCAVVCFLSEKFFLLGVCVHISVHKRVWLCQIVLSFLSSGVCELP